MDEDEGAKFTRKLWDSQYPQERYDIDFDHSSDFALQSAVDGGSRKIAYDLEAAVARQRSFYYQVSRPHMAEESFLRVALQRYKGFLYLLKLSNLKVFLVPTYDVDLMWHSHQTNPGAYREDMLDLLGKVLDHDDTDSDRTAGKKLDTGFSKTREYWQRNYGTLYERAGAMYRGEPPSPLPPTPDLVVGRTAVGSQLITLDQYETRLQARKTMQVYVAVLGARNVPIKNNADLCVRLLFQNKCSSLTIETPRVKATSDPEWNCSWGFQCETSTEGLQLELLLQYVSCFNFLTGPRVVGCVGISWQTLLDSPTLSWDGWVPLLMQSKACIDFKPPSLRISVSVTPPVTAPHLLRIENALLTDPEGRMKSCRPGHWLSKTVLDHTNQEAFTICTKFREAKSCFPFLVQIHEGHWEHDKKHHSAKIVGSAKQILESSDSKFSTMRRWSLFENGAYLVVKKKVVDLNWDLQPEVYLSGNFNCPVRLLCGRKLQYEDITATRDDEAGFVTLIRYSPDSSFGKATALFNWRSGAMEVSPEESVVLVLLLSRAIAVSMLDMQGSKRMVREVQFSKNTRRVASTDEWGSIIFDRWSCLCSNKMLQSYPWYSMSSILWMSTLHRIGSGCGGSCAGSGCTRGSGCGGCGSGCGGGCGNGKKVGISTGGGCGSGCGGGCGNGKRFGVSSGGGCGTGCGGGCGNGKRVGVSSGGGCGSGCGGGCGNGNKVGIGSHGQCGD